MKHMGIKIALHASGKRYLRDWIFRNFEMTFESGGSWAITGANGSGKSTLLQCLTAYQSLSAGQRSYERNGQPLSEDALFQYISIVTPYLELPEGYSLQEMLDFHFSLKTVHPGFNLHGLVQEAGLEKHLHKPIHQYSSGMKQRVKLILAFASETPLLFLDEPTTNLDQAGFEWYDSLLERWLQQKEASVFIASNQAHEYKRCTQEIRIADYKG